MSTSVNKSLATHLLFEEDRFSVIFSDGRILQIPVAYFPRLLKATPEQLLHYTISGGGTGLHWEELDEDILVENLLLGFGDTTRKTPSTTIAA